MTAKFRIKTTTGYFLRWTDPSTGSGHGPSTGSGHSFNARPEMISDIAKARQLSSAEADFVLLKMERIGISGTKEMIPRTTRKLPPDESTTE
jgi:hypothetical protein